MANLARQECAPDQLAALRERELRNKMDLSTLSSTELWERQTISSALVHTPTSIVQCFLKPPQSMPPRKPAQPHDSHHGKEPTDPAENNDGHPLTPNAAGMSAAHKNIAAGGTISMTPLKVCFRCRMCSHDSSQTCL
jgi:hypothetical protein